MLDKTTGGNSKERDWWRQPRGNTELELKRNYLAVAHVLVQSNTIMFRIKNRTNKSAGLPASCLSLGFPSVEGSGLSFWLFF